MALFLRDVDGWANMFFGKADEEAMDTINKNINYNTLEVGNE